MALESVPRAELDDYLDHIDYVVDASASSTSASARTSTTAPASSASRTRAKRCNVTRGLLSRGYSDADIAKIWSGNFLRVLAAAEAAAN